MKRVVSLSALCVLLSVSCSEPPAQRDAANPDVPAPQTTPTGDGQVAYNIGDVETAVHLTLQLAERSRVGNVQYSELETQRGDLRIAEAAINPPYPSQIWLMSKASTMRGFRETDAIVIRQRIFLEGREAPIAERSFVWSGRPAIRDPQTLEVDLVPFLDSLTGSLLLHARTEIFWLPDTDPTPINPNATFDDATRIERLSNTLRITFN